MLGFLMLDGSLVQTSILGVAVYLIVIWILRAKRLRNLPPGPRPLPLVGNLLQLKDKVSYRQFYEWSKVYGPTITVYIGPNPTVVVNNIETALEVLVKRGADFATRIKLNSTDVFTDDGRDIIMGQFGPTWRLHRKLTTKALRQYMQGTELRKRIHNSVKEVFKLMEKETGAYDPTMHVTLTVTNILYGMCFGTGYDFNDPEFKHLIKLVDEFNEVVGNGLFLEDFIPGLIYFPTNKFCISKNITAGLIDNIIGKKFKEHQATFDSGNIRDFADFLIKAKMEAEEDDDEKAADHLTDRHLIQTLNDIFFAGFDTSRLTLQFAILHMAAQQDIQAKVQQELDTVLGDDEMPSLVHRSRLSYTEAVLHESMRLATVAPTGISHKTTCDTKILSYDIPKGTDVIINHWALHFDPDKWSEVDKFIPERYLDKDGTLGPKPESWLPFSAGRRGCLGQSVAKPALHLIFAALMHRFTWRIADGMKADFEAKESFVVRTPKPHKFVIKRRHESLTCVSAI